MRNLTIVTARRCACGLSCLAVLAACGSQGDARAAAVVETLRADADPCGWVTPSEVEALVGPLEGPPRRGESAETTSPASDGRACVYVLAAGANGEPREVAVELVTEDATAFETGFSMVMEVMANELGPDLVGDGAGAATGRADGWDYTGWLPLLFVGRQGHLGVRVGTSGFGIDTDAVESLAALVRDRVPDRPFAATESDGFGSAERDPCSLVSRAEAEALLGALAVPPYRSYGESPLADPRGGACSYYLGKHRVLTIRPEWEDGRMMFGLTTGLLGQSINTVLGLRGEAADTLEGPWDQAGAGIGGSLYFLVGDRMLTVSYRTAGADAETAVRLAEHAATRLAQD